MNLRRNDLMPSEGVDALVKRMDIFLDILAKREKINLSSSNFAQKTAFIKQKSLSAYEVIEIPLSVARSNEMQAKSGQFFYILSIVDGTGAEASGVLKVNFNRNEGTPLSFGSGQGAKVPFDRLFLTNDAQSGLIATVLISEDEDELFKIIDNRLSSSISSVGSITNPVSIGQVSGTEVEARGQANQGAGSNPIVLHTVTSGYDLHLYHATISFVSISAVRSAELRHVDSGGTIVKTLLTVNGTTSQNGYLALTLPTAYVIPAGEKLELIRKDGGTDANDTASNVVLGGIYGIEVAQ